MTELPKKARAVVIGGGIVGCAVAYHLAKRGMTDVVLLERKQLTCGTTWHAAGLIGQLRATMNLTRLAKYSADLYLGLEAETGVATGFRQNGSISIALTEDRFEEFRRAASMAKVHGVEVETLSAADCARIYPLLNPKGIVGGIFISKDGQADPGNIAMALAKGARQRGVKIFEDTKVTGILVRNGRAAGVITAQGTIEAELVANCAGMWAREVGRMAGVNVPLQACEHFYMVTEPVPDLPRGLPVLRIPDECAYYKEDAGKILLGAFEPKAKPWGVDGIPEDFCFDQLPPDMDQIDPILEVAMNRLPLLQKTGIRTFFNGPESFTPDNRYLMGQAPELPGFFVACGFNSIGIQSAGGAGMALAEWMATGEAPFDLSDVDIRRMHPFQGTRAYLTDRVSETLGLLYADHFPYRQYASARGVRHTPLYEALKAQGACFGEAAGWERANWFLPPEARAAGEKPEYRYGWGRQNWFPYSAAEHRAVRNAAGLFDLSTFAKFRIEGRDAEAVLQRVAANDVAVEPGRIVYTQWLNPKGGIEADLTITRLADDAFLVVTSTASAGRDLAWLKRHVPEAAHCTITDVSAAEAVIAVMGPNARRLLQSLTTADLSNAAFPFATARQIEIGMALVRAHRLTYVGELGWELYVGSEFARHVFEVILAAGQAHGLRLCGMHALDSCRIEKAYRHYGHDIGEDDGVLEAGLGFAVKADKPAGRFGDFIGREAVLRKRQAGLSRRLMQFKLTDPKPLLFHTEPIWRDGRLTGYVTSANYGHHLGAAIGLGYVTCDPAEDKAAIAASRFEIEVAGRRLPAVASFAPFYDPLNERIRL